jgi:hypothetical protein
MADVTTTDVSAVTSKYWIGSGFVIVVKIGATGGQRMSTSCTTFVPSTTIGRGILWMRTHGDISLVTGTENNHAPWNISQTTFATLI